MAASSKNQCEYQTALLALLRPPVERPVTKPAHEQLALRPYHVTVLCSPDIAFVQDGTRRDKAFRWRQHAWYERQLSAAGISWLLASGGIQERVDAVARALGVDPVA